jgi:Tfp pilus assembly protein PilF
VGLAAARDTPPDVRAAARIGLALAAKEQGDLRTAQLQLARVVALQQAKAEVMAHALYEMAEVTEALGNKPVPAKTYRERLKALYPETSWAAKLN